MKIFKILLLLMGLSISSMAFGMEKLERASEKYGFIFPINEAFVEKLKPLDNKVGLVLGAAKGSLVKRLYDEGCNTIFVNEYEVCNRELMKGAFKEISSVTIRDEDDGLDCMTKMLEEGIKVDFICCHNVLHFFPQEKRSQWISKMHELLKPHGEVHVSYNSHADIANEPEELMLCECGTFNRALRRIIPCHILLNKSDAKGINWNDLLCMSPRQLNSSSQLYKVLSNKMPLFQPPHCQLKGQIIFSCPVVENDFSQMGFNKELMGFLRPREKNNKKRFSIELKDSDKGQPIQIAAIFRKRENALSLFRAQRGESCIKIFDINNPI